MHGIALNISCDLAHYDTIIPCGIVPAPGSGRGVTSITEEMTTSQRQDLFMNRSSVVTDASVFQTEKDILHDRIMKYFQAAFSDVFQVDFKHIEDIDSEDSTQCCEMMGGKYDNDSLQNLVAKMNINQNSVDNDILLPLKF